MPTLSFEQIATAGARLLQAAGVPDDAARLVGERLATANVCGVDSHGIQWVPYYIMLIREGLMKPKASWRIAKKNSSTALIDGGWGVGQVVCTEGMKLAVKKAKRAGVASVGIYNCSHIGRLGDYALIAARNKMIGVVYANTDPVVAPWGGSKRVLGTNPMSYAFPRGRENPITIDFASSAVAEGKIRSAYYRGEKIPEGLILDKEGNPSTDPIDLYGPPLPPDGLNIVGALLPAAGHKGFGLALAVDILGGALTGAGCDSDVKVGNGVFLQAINVESFVSFKRYHALVEKLVNDIKDTPRAAGVEEILIPGEPELRMMEKRKRDGIPVPDSTMKALAKLAGEFKLDLNAILLESKLA